MLFYWRTTGKKDLWEQFVILVLGVCSKTAKGCSVHSVDSAAFLA